MNIISKVIIWSVLAALCPVSSLLKAQIYHVRVGASGANNGLDWNNAFNSLPSTLERGATYFIADGDYAGHRFEDPTNGTEFITILKATELNHGTNVGWVSDFGDGQANFERLIIEKSYYKIDGVETTTDSFGFTVKIPSSGQGAGILIFKGNAPISNIILKSIHVFADVPNESIGIKFSGGLNEDCLVEHVKIVDSGEDGMLLHTFKNSIVSDVDIIGPNKLPGSTVHPDAIQIESSPSTFDGIQIIKNCRINWQGQGIFFGEWPRDPNFGVWKIFGNIFWVNHGVVPSASSTAIKNRSSDPPVELYIYNNSFYNWIRPYGLGTNVTGDIRNNISYGMTGSANTGSCTHDYNYYELGDSLSETNAQIGSNPYNNVTASDFTLIGPTDSGDSTIGTEYNTDMFGNIRGADGNWDRGAVEFVETSDISPPILLDISVSNVSSNGALITWTTNENSTSIVNYGTTAAYGQTSATTSLTTSHSVAITGLQSNTTYHYRVQSVDSFNNNSTSSDFTFTTTEVGTLPTFDNVYIRDGASGDGSDWLNALDDLPASLDRGKVYWVADGSYNNYVFDDPTDGENYITVRKANITNHGTGVGWLSNYGDGVAEFGPLVLDTDYINLEGASEYGIKIVGDFQSIVVRVNSNYANISHVELDGNFTTDSNGNQIDGACNGMNIYGNYITVENCDIHNMADDGIGAYGGDNISIIGNRIHNLHGCGTDGGCGPCFNGHSDGLELNDIKNVEIKNNLIYDIRSTAALYTGNWQQGSYIENLTLENNIFYTPDTGLCVYLQYVKGAKVFNNVIWGRTQGNRFGGLSIGREVTDLQMYNNIILNINYSHTGGVFDASEHDINYNHFGMINTGEYTRNTNDIVGDPLFAGIPMSSDPAEHLENITIDDFMLIQGSASINSGYSGDGAIVIPNLDILGNNRFGDGSPDRGVVELNASAPPPDADPDIDLNAGLMGYWNFNETSGNVANDTSNNGQDGIVEGASWSPGIVNNALSFDATDEDRVDLGDLNVSGNQITLAAWINPSTVPTDSRIISKATGTASTDVFWMLEIDDDTDGVLPLQHRLGFRVNSGGTYFRLTGGVVQTGQWTHIVGVYDGTVMRLYQDGILVASEAKNGALREGTADVWIGDNPPGGQRSFDGLIDEVRIYDRALNVEEIALLRDATIPLAPEGLQIILAP